MQNPMIDITDREPGNNESPEVLYAINSDEFLNELWPGLGDDEPEPKRYPCQECGEMVTAEEAHPTADEMDIVCEECHFYGAPTNEATVRY